MESSAPNRLKELREAAGLTQQQLAELVGTAGQQIGKLEKGERKLTLEWMERIGRALNRKPIELLPQGMALDLKEPDAARYEARSDPGYEQRVLGTLYPGHPNAMLYEVRSSVLDLIGYRRWDLVVIDFSQQAVDAVAPRDVVLAAVVSDEFGETERLLRLYVPPLLLTQSSVPGLHDSLEVGKNAQIVGVAKMLIRNMDRGAL